ncbi:MAG TPA: hypothetical protein DDZ51_14930 [Planctomycetaceae bacterium]|nr:hypothetical protein [Planctomycetaceae bacterium]
MWISLTGDDIKPKHSTSATSRQEITGDGPTTLVAENDANIILNLDSGSEALIGSLEVKDARKFFHAEEIASGKRIFDLYSKILQAISNEPEVWRHLDVRLQSRIHVLSFIKPFVAPVLITPPPDLELFIKDNPSFEAKVAQIEPWIKKIDGELSKILKSRVIKAGELQLLYSPTGAGSGTLLKPIQEKIDLTFTIEIFLDSTR